MLVVFFFWGKLNGVQYIILQKLCLAIDRRELNVELICISGTYVIVRILNKRVENNFKREDECVDHQRIYPAIGN